MKTLMVILMLLVVKGVLGNVIPQNGSESSKPISWQQPYWDLLGIGSEIYAVAVEGFSQSEIGKAIQADSDGFLGDWVVSSMKELYTLTKELTWKGEPLIDQILNQTSLLQEKLESAGEQLHGVIGEERYATIHEKLQELRGALRHSSMNQNPIADSLDQVHLSAVRQVEKSSNIITPYIENISQQLQDLRQYLTSVVHNATEEFKILVKANAGATAAT
ncbi:uncharacterized protein LOC125466880 isoform X2 [Stegostoma tigrinum]|uniref:uncharacterized protein LOC125466880 isoform X2 n=1 Tax=Stegostoma tigrinum TaxID=3053191 RepID=UPI00202B2990|nr:uncharacterized protein LOC125466880 isoform X2 [Stegostoma tigrinum]